MGLSAAVSSSNYAKQKRLIVPLGVSLGLGSLLAAFLVVYTTMGKVKFSEYQGYFGLIVFIIFLLAFPLSLLFGKTVGYVFSFIPIYILCRILFKYLHPWLPYFKGVHRMLHAGGEQATASLDGRPMIHNGPSDPLVNDDPKPSPF